VVLRGDAAVLKIRGRKQSALKKSEMMLLPVHQKGRIKLVVLMAFLVIGGGLAVWLQSSGTSTTVVQPIVFNHRIHVEKQIDCSFCHQHVTSQVAAGLPSVQLCITCHSVLPKQTPEIDKIFAFAEKKQEIPWVRVYQLPEHAYVVFNHKRHIAANVACTVCHGEVAQMTVAEPVVNHTMGWCVDCHKQNESKFPSAKLATDCLTCHK
jgi:hypothetical protein